MAIKKVTNKSTPEEKEKVVYDLIKLLIKHDMFSDVNIYCNDKRWKSEWDGPGKPEDKDCYLLKDKDQKTITPVYVQNDVKAYDYIAFANPNLITMSYEGPLYDALNYGYKMEKELTKFFEARGLWFEYGYAWSLSVYAD